VVDTANFISPVDDALLCLGLFHSGEHEEESMLHILLALHVGAFHVVSGLLPIIPNAGVVHSVVDFFAKSGHSLLSACSAGLVVFGLSIQDLLQKKGEFAKQAADLIDVKDGVRSEDEAKFNAFHADIDKLDKQIAMLAKQEAIDKSLTDSQGRRSDPPQPNDGERAAAAALARRSATRVDAGAAVEGLRSWFLAGSDVERTPEMRERATKAGFNLEQRSITLKLAPVGMRSSALRAPSAEDIREWQERAAMGTTSGAVGAYTVPNEAMRPLEVALLAYGGMRQVATVIRTDSGASLTENIAASEVDVTFGQLTLDAYKYSSKYLLISVELLQDSAINVAEWIGTALGIRIGRITNDHFTTGTGSSQPNGIVTAATLGKTAAAVAAVTYDEMVDLVHSVDPAYRDNGKFMFHDGGLKMLKKIKVLQYSGDVTGIPLWSPGLSPGQPNTILSYPYIVNQSMTTPATAVKSILFGDFSKYIIRDVRDITLLRLDERFAEFHQVAYLAFSRQDGDLLDAGTHPVSYLVQA
jgi:HK97 family phage major capsid protein